MKGKLYLFKENMGYIKIRPHEARRVTQLEKKLEIIP
jgi:hypothetical protein